MKTHNFKLAEFRLGPSIERKFTTETWCVLTLHRGALSWTSRERVVDVRPGEAAVLSPGIRAVVQGRMPGELIGYYFCFRAEELGSLFGTPTRLLFEKAARDSTLARILPSQSPVSRKLKALSMEAAPAATPEQRGQILSLLPMLIHELQSDLHARDNGDDGAKARILATVIQLTDAEIHSVSVEDLARRCSCSRRHFTRLVQEHFGCTAVELKTHVRLDRAAELLKDPEAKVLNVALECGFGHLGQFAAQFRKRFGVTPTEWRATGGNGGNTRALRDEPPARNTHVATLRFDPEPAVPLGIAVPTSPAQDFLSCL